MEEIYDITTLSKEITDAGQTYFDIIGEKTTYRLENFPQTDASIRKLNEIKITDYYNDTKTETCTFSTIAPKRQFITSSPTAEELKQNAYISTEGTMYILLHNSSDSTITLPKPTDAPDDTFNFIKFETTTQRTYIYTGKFPSSTGVNSPSINGNQDCLLIIPPVNQEKFTLTNNSTTNQPIQTNQILNIYYQLGEPTTTRLLLDLDTSIIKTDELFSKTS